MKITKGTIASPEKLNLRSIVDALRSALPKDKARFALHEPCFQGNEWGYVKDCIDTGWVSPAGPFVERFERDLATFTGVKEAVAVVNGTTGLLITLKLVGVRPDDEVLVPDLAFVAVANATSHAGAVPHFLDSSQESLGVDPEKLESWLEEIVCTKGGESFNRVTHRRIKALIAVHVFGHPVDLDEISRVCRRFSIELIEDASEALGSSYKGIPTGNSGRAAVLSFNGNKILTTGGGGAILTQDEGLARQARHLVTTAKQKHKWEFYHDAVGYNFRMPNINAALGVAQLEELPHFLKVKRELAERYRRAFANAKGVRFFSEPPFAKSNYWLNAILLDQEFEEERDNVLAITHDEGILTRPVWTPMHKLPMYQGCPRMDVSTVENLEARIINIPSSAFL